MVLWNRGVVGVFSGIASESQRGVGVVGVFLGLASESQRGRGVGVVGVFLEVAGNYIKYL